MPMGVSRQPAVFSVKIYQAEDIPQSMLLTREFLVTCSPTFTIHTIYNNLPNSNIYIFFLRFPVDTGMGRSIKKFFKGLFGGGKV